MISKRAAPYVLLAPVFVFGTLFFVVPLGFSLGVSFTEWNSLGPPTFVGLSNYAELFVADPLFVRSLGITALFVGGTLALGTPLALGAALLMRRSRLRGLWRTLYWLPMTMNVVAVAYVWRSLLDDPYGLVNRALALAGVAGPAWLADPATAMAAVIVVFVWFQLGQDMMVFAVALDGLDPAVEDAARMDGASGPRVFRYVTLPLIAPAVLFVTLTNLIKGVGYFSLMLVMTEGGPVNATNVAALRMYDLAFTDLRLGMASAAAYTLFAVVFALAAVQLRLMRRGGVEGWA